MGKGRTEMEVGADGVAVITIVNPPYNALSIDAMYSLVRNYEEACLMNDCFGELICLYSKSLLGKGGIFCGGLDISILGAIQKHALDQLKVDYIDIMNDALEVAKKPLVAAIEGLAFGAGLELSMACQARISTPTAHLCLPELQLGVIPGFGGTQRLPRLVGLKAALEMILIGGVTDLGLMPRSVTKVAVVGGGLMGSGITTTLILNHYPVILKEVNEKLLNAGVNKIKANLQRHVRKGKLTEEECEKTLSLLTDVLDYKRFKEADLVIEASPITCHHQSIFPSHIMSLLEIVRTQHTSPQAVIDLLDVGKKIKKTPIVVTASSGFAVNRMFFPYIRTSLCLLDHGMDLYKIDRACTEFGMTVGPFRLDIELAHHFGFGVAPGTGKQYIENFPDGVYKSLVSSLMIEDKSRGSVYQAYHVYNDVIFFKKMELHSGLCSGASQKGFYMYYEGRRKAIPDPETMKYVKKLSMAEALTDPELMKLEDKDIVEMVLFPVINEACRLLDEGVASKASDLDIASIFGVGFPPYRGGIMYWADSIGAKRIHVKLSEWEKNYGQFFRPCSYLSERAAGVVTLVRTMAGISASTGQAKARL
nr:unnamed protein product [Digitaria exilis]